MRYRVAVVTHKTEFLNKSCETLEEVYDWLLSLDYKKYRIEENGVLIETEDGKK